MDSNELMEQYWDWQRMKQQKEEQRQQMVTEKNRETNFIIGIVVGVFLFIFFIVMIAWIVSSKNAQLRKQQQVILEKCLLKELQEENEMRLRKQPLDDSPRSSPRQQPGPAGESRTGSGSSSSVAPATSVARNPDSGIVSMMMTPESGDAEGGNSTSFMSRLDSFNLTNMSSIETPNLENGGWGNLVHDENAEPFDQHKPFIVWNGPVQEKKDPILLSREESVQMRKSIASNSPHPQQNGLPDENRVKNQQRRQNHLVRKPVPQTAPPTTKITNPVNKKTEPENEKKNNTTTAVQKLNPKDWDSISDDRAVIMIYTDWCGACKRVMPVFHSVANKNTQSLIEAKGSTTGVPSSFYLLNGDEAKELLDQLGVRAFPTLILRIKDDRKTNAGTETSLNYRLFQYDHRNGFSEENLLQFANE